MKIRITHIILLLATLSRAGLLHGQDMNANIYRYSINNGLSQNTVSHIMQDETGFLWISSQDGISKYDGYKFETFRHNPTNAHSLSSNYVNMACGGSDSTLWVATQYGLNKYDFKTQLFKVYFHKPDKPTSLINDNVDYVFKDSQDIIWVKTKHGLSRYNKETDDFTFFKHRYYEFSYTSEYNHFYIGETEGQYLWLATKDGIARFDKKNEQFAYYYPEGEEYPEKNEVFNIFIDDDDTFWVAAAKGLYKFNPKKAHFSKVPVHNDSSTVRVIFRDSKRILWLGTESGLAYYDNYNNSITAYKPADSENHSIAFGSVSWIMQDAAQILWVSSNNGSFKIDRKSKKFRLIRKAGNFGPQISNNRIFSVYVDNADRIWLGTRKHGLNIINKIGKNVTYFNQSNSKLKDNNIHCIQKDRDGKISVGTNKGAYFFIPKEQDFISFSDYFHKDFYRFKNNRISKIILDRQGRYWFATNNGLLYFDGNDLKPVTDSLQSTKISEVQTFDVIERKNGDIWAASVMGLTKIPAGTDKLIYYTKENSGLSNNSTMSLYETEDETLWVGTETGLNKYNARKDSFIFYTSDSHGFANDYIYAILESNDKNLWLSTNRGLIRFNPKNEEVQNYTPEDGLQGYEFNIGSAFKKKKTGELYFGGVNGLNIFNPEHMPINTYAPKPIITHFEKLSSKGKQEVRITNGGTVNLKPDERSFTIHFTIPEYTHPHRNKYKYRIKELEADWTPVDENFVSYNMLQPGSYTFLVMGANSDNVWNDEPAKLYIIIETPWWNTTAAHIIYAALILLTLYAGFMFYSRKMRLENKILQAQKKASEKISAQKEELSLKNKSINDSIHYAKRIIDAMIPTNNFVKMLLPESFILFMPKDIVSGDFYWIDSKDDKIFVAAVDCTGHGVPGAFMSIIGLDLLRDILSLGIESPSEILDRLNSEVAKIFKNDQNDSNVKDGMDVSICAIDKKNKRLEFAGAKNPLYLIRDNQIIEIKGDRFSIGPTEEQKHRKFKNHIIDLEEEDVIYLFSDGYADQFGGPNGKKFKFRRFRHTLLDICQYDFEYQKLSLLEVFHNWKADLEQVDDVIVMGIKPLAEPKYKKLK